MSKLTTADLIICVVKAGASRLTWGVLAGCSRQSEIFQITHRGFASTMDRHAAKTGSATLDQLILKME